MPSGGAVPGSDLKGVMRGSWESFMYVYKRWSSISCVHTILRLIYCIGGDCSCSCGEKSIADGLWGHGNLKGSGASLSGLVQLPPKEGKEARLPLEETDESDMPEQAESGRTIDSPRILKSLMSQSLWT